MRFAGWYAPAMADPLFLHISRNYAGNLFFNKILIKIV
ncbi:hypothetical protein SAMN04488055_4613 [Chitinophaga niabensis]|uniref:Uncharacterized protein n=1 Tax=Chitinophaga niabensis TaxID=536979 RepID=A0A1N6JXK1_9BACT|nr:hypothetical protein SAMN04488055_4613 [Chitinophaga niabensis]